MRKKLFVITCIVLLLFTGFQIESDSLANNKLLLDSAFSKIDLKILYLAQLLDRIGVDDNFVLETYKKMWNRYSTNTESLGYLAFLTKQAKNEPFSLDPIQVRILPIGEAVDYMESVNILFPISEWNVIYDSLKKHFAHIDQNTNVDSLIVYWDFRKKAIEKFRDTNLYNLDTLRKSVATNPSLELYDRILEIDPYDIDALSGKIQVLKQQEEIDDEEYEKLLLLYEKVIFYYQIESKVQKTTDEELNFRLLKNLADFQKNQNEHRDALRTYNRILEIDRFNIDGLEGYVQTSKILGIGHGVEQAERLLEMVRANE